MTGAIEIAGDLAGLDAAIEALPNRPAVFLLWPEAGEPYLSKTNLLRRRLLRLLKEREKPSRLLNLRYTVKRIEYRFTGSAFESSVAMYEEARRHFPERYLDVLRQMSPGERLRKACELSDETRRLFKIGLAHRFPELSPEELHALYLEKLYGYKK